MASLLVSTELAVAATGITLAAALPAAFTIDRHRFAGRALLQAGLMSPMIVPVIVLAIGLLQLLTWLGLAGSFLGLLIGQGRRRRSPCGAHDRREPFAVRSQPREGRREPARDAVASRPLGNPPSS